MIKIENNFGRINSSEHKLINTLTQYLVIVDKSDRDNPKVLPLYEIDTNGDLLIPIGLLKFIPESVSRTNVAIQNIPNEFNVDYDEIAHSFGDIVLREDQLIAIRKMLLIRRGIMQLATGSGKTEIMAGFLMGLNKICGYIPDTMILEPTLLLVKSTVKRLKKYGINAKAYSSTRGKLSGVIVTHPASLNNDLEKNPKLLETLKVFLSDECLPKSAKILLADGKTVVSIEELYYDDSITEVMSYNIETNKYEPKKILNKYRTEYNRQFWKVYYTNPITGEEQGICATPNHKIWTYNRGYVPLEELTADDYIKVDVSSKTYRSRSYICEYCQAEFTDAPSLGGHVVWCKLGPYRVKASANNHVHREDWKSPFSNPEIHKKAMINRSNNLEYRKYLSDRMKINNPMNCEETKAKMIESLKSYYDLHPDKLEERKRNYIKSSHSNNHITNLEQMIIDLNIPGLEFTGNSEVIQLADGRRKMPDFTFRNGNEVKYIEISSKCWYDSDYIDYVVKNYTEAGLEVLYLTDDNLDDYELRIHKFLFNHKVKVNRIRKSVGRVAQYKYNIEVEDNHNYFADNVLVSNCHHLQAKTWYDLQKSTPQIEFSLGLSASVINPNRLPIKELGRLDYQEALVVGATGDVIMNVPPSFYIQKGILANPILFRLANPADEYCKKNYDWHQIRKNRLESEYRTQLVAKCSAFFASQGYKSLILVGTKEHAYRILKLIHEYGLGDLCRCSFGGGSYYRWDSDKSEAIICKNESTMEGFESGLFKIFIGTSHIYEGADIPNLDAVVLSNAGKTLRKVIQGIGRAIRKTKTGKYAYIVDFTDHFDKILSSHSRSRREMCTSIIGVEPNHIYDSCSFETFKQKFCELEEIHQ